MYNRRILTWEELINQGRDLSETERVLVQLVATISTHPDYRHIPPEEIYARHVEVARVVGNIEEAHNRFNLES
jgi:hypothetical protein